MTKKTVDVCIVGSGPAGLQAAYFFKKKGIGVRILERGPAVSDFFRHFPRHRQFISINKVNTGLSDPETLLRHDWNSLINDEGHVFKDYSRKYFPPADDFVRYADDFAKNLDADIRFDSEVVRVSKVGGVFSLETSAGEQHQARNVIVATGVSKPWDPGIDGFELADNYMDFDTNPEIYENKRVLILGKGNSAFETADSLIEHAASIHVMSPNPIRFAWQTHFVGHLRAVNNNFLDTYQLKSQNAVLDAKALRIEKTDGEYTVTAAMSAAEGHEIVLTYDHVIACTGFRFDADIFDAEVRPALRHFDKFPAMTAEWESETVEGLYFAGTIMQSRDYRKTMSGFVHGFRHNVKCLVDIMAEKLAGQPVPTVRLTLQPDVLTGHIIDRISTASGIFLQPGFLCDTVLLDGPQGGESFQDMPVEWVGGRSDMKGRRYLQVTLEYGDFGGNSLHVKRTHTVDGSKADAFIHPVIRLIQDGEVLHMAHLSDHLDADWRMRRDRDPGSATVLRMTFKDAGETLSPAEVAVAQIKRFLEDGGALATKEGAVVTAAE